jgi:hypothetical protein
LLALGLNAQSGNPVKTYFAGLAADPKATIDLSQLSETCERINAAPVAEVRDTLPILDRMLKMGNADQRGAAALALFSVGRRPDGTQLLTTYVPDLVAALRDTALGVARMSAMTLYNLFPKPVEPIVPAVIQYVSDSAANEEMRSGLVGLLAEYAPRVPEATAAIVSFMREDHSIAVRESALNDIGNAQPHAYSSALVSLIIEAIERDPATRFTSVQALGRCGRKAAEVAIPVLDRIAHDDQEKPEIRKMAEAGIDYIRHSAQ